MNIQNKISCTVMHPKLFPAYFLDPFNPQRINAIVEIDTDKLSFLSLPSIGKSRLPGNVPLDNVHHVAIQNLSVKAQRLEILRKSLIRYLVLSTVFSIYLFLFKSAPLFTGTIIALTAAIIILPLNFLFNGGFAVKNEVVRFLFTPIEPGKSFYLEVEQGYEPELQKALLTFGLKFAGDEENQESWECDECGAVVEASAVKCPNCGANFED
jgi:hypothetical protein